jgi:hypothetical protein
MVASRTAPAVVGAVGELQAARAPSSVAISSRVRRGVGVIAHLGIGKGTTCSPTVGMIAVPNTVASGGTEAQGGEMEGELWSAAWA